MWNLVPNLADGEAKDLLKIRWLTDKEQVEGPAAAEVGHNDCIDGHGGKETTPRSLEFLCLGDGSQCMLLIFCVCVLQKNMHCCWNWQHIIFTHLSRTHLVVFFTDCGLDVGPLLICDCGMFSGTSICQQQPQDIPYDPKNTFAWHDNNKKVNAVLTYT